MIVNPLAGADQPIAYSGGAASTAAPSFGASLQGVLAKIQATSTGTATLLGALGGQTTDAARPADPTRAKAREQTSTMPATLHATLG